MDILDSSNDVTIYNPLSIDWSKFKFYNGYYTHLLTQLEIEQFWTISYAYYGDIKFEEIILILNGIEDLFDLEPGANLIIPKEEDLREFILQETKQR